MIYIFFFKISSLAHMILRWHSWIAHVVFYSSLRPTIYKLMWSSGRENVGSPMLRILLSQKLVLVKVVTLHIPIIWKWGWGRKWTQHEYDGMWWTNHILCFWKNMALSGTPYFPWIPLRDLETWNYGACFFSFACVQASFFLFFCSIAPCLLSLRDYRRYV